ncbi:hypothetical protein SAMN06295905_1510 [Devosia lucknowensis]|uniref:Uncharacterized protein n=1 Tax=Devosia lucknowensis TaxID=1096929 RepID=A0A1Y6EVE8_9HYPH|nr:hypothetical protein [Devosia lucknowensis]SMQ66527.1 hypothetical protein SAMN06295905_1510 [Devosia lucknowensis]
MVLSLAVEPVTSGATHMSEFRYRPAMGERTVLPDGPQKSPAGARPGDRDRLPFEPKADKQEQPAETERDRSADFAAAVIAGALSPTPQTMGELLRRIGSAEIPEESQARLKDLLA